MAGMRALCVGINQYQNYPTATLRGCVNDARAMAAVCNKLFHFSTQEITVLQDHEATKANIMNHLRGIVDEAIAGKVKYIVFSMSSHGTQVSDVEGDETDRADEAFCPHDLAETNLDWDRQHIIVDDELHDLFIKLPEHVLLEVFMDTCHSGTGLKAMDFLPDRKPRLLPPPSPIALARVQDKRYHSLERSLLESKMLHHILWAACRADETSEEANFADQRGQRLDKWHGVFTYYFCKEIHEHPKASRKELLAMIRADILKGHYAQTPQLELNAIARRLGKAGWMDE